MSIKHVQGVAPVRYLKLIAPVQVELLKDTEFNGAEYVAGDILTVEKHRGIKMVQSGQAKQASGAVDRNRSANQYLLVDAQGNPVAEKPAAVPAPAPVEREVQAPEDKSEPKSKN